MRSHRRRRERQNSPLGSNVVGTEVYSAAFSRILSSGGLLCSDWLPLNHVIAHYHKVDLISTLLDALIVQNALLSPELAAGSH